jgi:hypothetical protein
MNVEEMNEQPEALRLVELIERGNYNHYDVIEAAAELRRLHDVLQELRSSLHRVGGWLDDEMRRQPPVLTQPLPK